MTAFHWTSVADGWNQDIDDVFGDPDLYFVLSGLKDRFTLPTVENSLTLSLADLSVVILNEQTHHVDFYDRDVITETTGRGGPSRLAARPPAHSRRQRR